MLWLEEGHFCFLGCSAQSWNFEIHSGPEEKVPPPEAKLSSEPAEQSPAAEPLSPRLMGDFRGGSPRSFGERGGEDGRRGHHLPRGVSALAGCRAPSGRPGRPCCPGLCSVLPDAAWGEPGARREDHSSLTMTCVCVLFGFFLPSSRHVGSQFRTRDRAPYFRSTV